MIRHFFLFFFIFYSCSSKKNLDRSLVNGPGMDFDNTLAIPQSSAKYFLGSQVDKDLTGGCSTCAK